MGYTTQFRLNVLLSLLLYGVLAGVVDLGWELSRKRKYNMGATYRVGQSALKGFGYDVLDALGHDRLAGSVRLAHPERVRALSRVDRFGQSLLESLRRGLLGLARHFGVGGVGRMRRTLRLKLSV